MLYIIDTYAWVEYLTGSEKGKRVKELFQDTKNRFITIECCLAELKGWTIKENLHFQEILNIVQTNSKIIPVLMNDWIHAAAIKSEIAKGVRDFGLVDALLIAKQNNLKCRIITADKHFTNLKNIEFLK